MNEQEAIAYYESEAWKNLSYRERAVLQLTEDRLCMPFSVFHKAVEVALGRPVYTHEFASGNRLLDELRGVPKLN